jgi:hypothetical protein
VAETSRLIPAAELDQMTPDQRAALFAERTVTDLDDLPEDFRRKVIATAERLAGQIDTHSTR